jgi:hypothetical protein
MRVTPAYEKPVLNLGKSLCLFRKVDRAYASIPCSKAMTVKPSCDCRTSFWKACVCFPMVLLRLRSTGLREACCPFDSLPVSLLGGCGTTGGWAPAGVGGLRGS